MTREGAPVWPSYVRAALALALSAGFGVGGALFAAASLRVPLGAWWPAAAQAHGHAQLFGWAGLMVLGVGFHFLPRLRGAPPVSAAVSRAVLLLLFGGLVLRALAQPGLALSDAGDGQVALRVCLAASGALELAGASLALRVLAQTLRSGPPLAEHRAVRSVLPFFLAAFGAFWLALVANALGVMAAALSAGALVPAEWGLLTVQLACYGFLVPVSVAMSARTFPLYFRTPLPRMRMLHLGLLSLLAGLALRTGGELTGTEAAASAGGLLQAAAVGAFVVGLGVFAPRRPLPRAPVRPLSDPTALHVISAYVWLLVAAALIALPTLARMGVLAARAPRDAELHALGAGFVTLLILGVGARMLPGFARRPLRSTRFLWLTLLAANAAALLRVGPLVLPSTTPDVRNGLLASAGLTGLLALSIFAANIGGARCAGLAER